MLFRVLSFAMPYSNYLKQRVLVYHDHGLSPRAIADALAGKGMSATRQGIAKLLARYSRTGSLARAEGSDRPAKVSPTVQAVVDEQMRTDEETTVVQLRHPSSKRLRTISVYHLA